MAIGIALMFNIMLPKNFESPYKATSVINFWERWHITLSKFITTYIYTPLVRSFPGRITFYKSMIATLIAMFIAGLWHGAAWTYVLFGLFHGIGLVINHIWRRRKIKIPVWLAWYCTFVFVNISFIIFRAGSIENALIVIKAMFGLYNHQESSWFDLHMVDVQTIQKIPWLNGLDEMLSSKILVGGVLSLLLSMCLLCKNSSGIYERFQPNLWYALLQVFLIVIPLFMMNGVIDFVYFQF